MNRMCTFYEQTAYERGTKIVSLICPSGLAMWTLHFDHELKPSPSTGNQSKRRKTLNSNLRVLFSLIKLL